jgi:hypothetical protein
MDENEASSFSSGVGARTHHLRNRTPPRRDTSHALRAGATLSACIETTYLATESVGFGLLNALFAWEARPPFRPAARASSLVNS